MIAAQQADLYYILGYFKQYSYMAAPVLKTGGRILYNRRDSAA